MRTHRLTRAPNGAPRETVSSLQLDERLGVVGDHKSEKDGSVSLLSREAEEQIRSLGGLCTAKCGKHRHRRARLLAFDCRSEAPRRQLQN
ncbi:MAG: hypothetical protein R2881_00610 [Eubacteriales bacterium]